MSYVTSKNWQISRRAVLKGLGATVALPFLEAMAPTTRSLAAGGGAPVRMAFLFMPNGVRPDKWTPQGEGEEFQLSPLLSPLEKHKRDVLVLSGLGNMNSRTGDGHYAKTANWLTGTPIEKTMGKNLRCGVSVDQVYAAERGHLTRFPSLELGTEPTHAGVDLAVNYTKLYGSHISWRTPTSPIPTEINPRYVFDRLFRSDAEQRKARAAENRSVLDLVLDEARALRGRVGREDQKRLDEYLESIRQLERRIDADIERVKTGENLDPSVTEGIAALDKRIAEAMKDVKKDDPGSQLRLDHTEHVRCMMDLMTLAFQTDSTRVSTFMFGWAVSSKNFSFIPGVSQSHHETSHHQDQEDKLAQYEKINRWHVEQYVYLLDKLAGIREGERTLLDNSMILFGSSIRDGNKHDPKDLPLVVAGGRGAGVESGRHLASAPDTPLCNLYHGMLNRAGVEAGSFGDSSAALI